MVAAAGGLNVPMLLASEIGMLGGILWYILWIAPTLWAGRVAWGEDAWLVVLLAAWFALGLIGLWDSYPWSLEAGWLLAVAHWPG